MNAPGALPEEEAVLADLGSTWTVMDKDGRGGPPTQRQQGAPPQPEAASFPPPERARWTGPCPKPQRQQAAPLDHRGKSVGFAQPLIPTLPATHLAPGQNLSTTQPRGRKSACW